MGTTLVVGDIQAKHELVLPRVDAEVVAAAGLW